PNIRASAARSLGRVGGEDEIPALLQALENQNHQIRASAAEALGEIGSKKVIPALFQAIEVKTPLDSLVVHPKVIEAIGKIGDSEELPQLNKLLLKPKITVRENLLTAIAAIQSRCGFYNYEIAQYSPPELNVTDTIEWQPSQINIYMSDNKFDFDQRGATIGVNVASEGSNIKFIQHAKQNINISEQDLAEAAQKIQALLNQLAQSYPPTSEPQQQTFIQKFLERLESTPNHIKVILAGGIEGLKILCPPAGIPVEMARCLYEVVQERYGQP
ncbi:HEAT repeat domain-containing protein, partial [Coleofasciculus sp.]